ncbi:UNVERIFIED_CONTAM: protein phosphatase 2C 57 [Sesamum angustifolium]|uniref:protein-serine/threonine phosphatase n=1 Tax=Sesamum angustifolium TaxID=2727405 RepID=A0AAW2PRC1_9LAMI
MALCSPQLQKFLLNNICSNYVCNKASTKNVIVKGGEGRKFCSAIAIDAPASLAGVSGIRWGSVKLKGAREEMEDDVVIVQSDRLDGFSFAAVFDGHAGFSSVEFLRLETNGEGDESGSTATAIFIREDVLFISHVGDSCLVLSRSGKTEVLTDSHRPYGNNKVSLQEIRRIREAGGWIVNGRICGDISVSRSFGDIRFKNKKSDIQLKGDFVTALPDVFQVELGSDAEFIVLASDGLWDYVNSSDAINFIRNQLRQHGDVQMASEALAQMALNRRSQDNISIVIADLGQTDWRNLPVEKQNVVYELGQAMATISLVSLAIWMSTLLSS